MTPLAEVARRERSLLRPGEWPGGLTSGLEGTTRVHGQGQARRLAVDATGRGLGLGAVAAAVGEGARGHVDGAARHPATPRTARDAAAPDTPALGAQAEGAQAVRAVARSSRPEVSPLASPSRTQALPSSPTALLGRDGGWSHTHATRRMRGPASGLLSRTPGAQLYFRVQGMQAALLGPVPLAAPPCRQRRLLFPISPPLPPSVPPSPQAAGKGYSGPTAAATAPPLPPLRPPFALVADLCAAPPQGHEGSCVSIYTNVALVNRTTVDLWLASEDGGQPDAAAAAAAAGSSSLHGARTPASRASSDAGVGGAFGSGPSSAVGTGGAGQDGPVLLQRVAPGGRAVLPAALLRRTAPLLRVQLAQHWSSAPPPPPPPHAMGGGSPLSASPWSQPIDIRALAQGHPSPLAASGGIAGTGAGANSGAGAGTEGARGAAACHHLLLSCGGAGMAAAVHRFWMLAEAQVSDDGQGWELCLTPPVVLRNNLPVPVSLTLASESSGLSRQVLAGALGRFMGAEETRRKPHLYFLTRGSRKASCGRDGG